MYDFGYDSECSEPITFKREKQNPQVRYMDPFPKSTRKLSYSSVSSSSVQGISSDGESDGTNTPKIRLKPHVSENGKQECEWSVRLLLIGEAAVGKSSLFSSYKNDPFRTDTMSTIGIDFHTTVERIRTTVKKKMIDKNIRVQVWDTAGQERFRNITRNHFRGVHGVIIVFDLTSRESFEKLTYWIRMANDALGKDCPRVIVGNKCDLTEKRDVSFDEASLFCRCAGIPYVETSAKTGFNVESIFSDLVETCIKNEIYDEIKSSINVKLDHKKSKKRFNCC